MNAFAHSYKGIIGQLYNYQVVSIGALHGDLKLNFAEVPVNNAVCLFQKR
jgi:hypothetical protein